MEEVKKEVKEVQTSHQSSNLYLTILNLLKQGKNPSKISKELNIKKQNLQYYLSVLSKKGAIKKVGYGTWEVQSFNSNTITITKNNKSIRGHAFIWNIKVPKEIGEYWIKILEKSKLDYKLVRGQTPRIYLNNKKVWLGKKTITLYEPNSFYGQNAVESRKYAIITLLEDLKQLESKLQINLGKYIFIPSREHYALIKNDLARQCNRNGEKIIIHDEVGEWLWIDDSNGLGELETGNHKALPNSLGVQKWWNDMKDTKFEVTPKFILNSINEVTQNQLMFNKNFESHVEAIQTLSKSVGELTNQVKLLQEENRRLRE